MRLLVQFPGKLLCVMSNLVTKTYPEFVTLHSRLKFFFLIFKNVKKIEKIHMDSEKLINSIEISKRIGQLIIYDTNIFF